MPTTIITGTLGPIRQPDRIEFSPRSGRQTWAVYNSADPTQINSLRLSFEEDGKTCRSYGDGAINTCEVLIGGDDGENNALQDSWAIVANELQRGDRQSNAWLSLPQADREEIDAKLAENIAPSATGFSTSSLKHFFYKRLYYNADSFSLSQYVLKHTTIASPNYGANVSDASVETIYTFNQLISEITSASLWVTPCPGRLVAKIETIPTPDDVDADDSEFYLWGWRKLPSTEEQQPDGNIQIQTEYWLGLWPTPHYRTI